SDSAGTLRRGLRVEHAASDGTRRRLRQAGHPAGPRRLSALTHAGVVICVGLCLAPRGREAAVSRAPARPWIAPIFARVVRFVTPLEVCCMRRLTGAQARRRTADAIETALRAPALIATGAAVLAGGERRLAAVPPVAVAVAEPRVATGIVAGA